MLEYQLVTIGISLSCSPPLAQGNLIICSTNFNELDMEDWSSVCATMAIETGYTGLSILHRLNHIPLRVVSYHLHYYFNEMIILS